VKRGELRRETATVERRQGGDRRAATPVQRRNVRVLAAHIARVLFTNGAGQIAQRLVLVKGVSTNLGGWSEPAAVEQIVRALSAPPPAREEN
jgi:hypothetical protein